MRTRMARQTHFVYPHGKLPPITLDFTGKVAGSAIANPHVAKWRTSPTNTEAPSNTVMANGEFNATGYSRILNTESTSQSDSVLVNTYYAQHLLSFDILSALKRARRVPSNWTANTLKTRLKSFRIEWVGYGVGSNAGISTNGANLKAWNSFISAWQGTSSNTTSNPSALTPTNTHYVQPSDISRMLDANGQLHVLVHSTHPSNGTIASTIFTDHIRLIVEVAPNRRESMGVSM